MATDETDDRTDENRKQGTTQAMTLSERTVTVDHVHLAELRCGITLGEVEEAADTRQSSSAEADPE